VASLRIARGSRRERIFVAIAGFLVHLVMRVLGATTRKTDENGDELRGRFARNERVILAFWHGRIVMMPFAYSGRGVCIMNSGHRDGALVSHAIRPFGIEVVYGSSTRGWVRGLRGLLEAHRRGKDLAVVPDGPRGPRCRAKSGAVQLARATGAPIYPIAFGASRGYVLKRSWDWLLIPAPFARVHYVAGEALRVPPDATPEGMEELRVELERRLNRVTARADEAVGVALRETVEYTRSEPEPGLSGEGT
jgi:lysophospholipid acyltransferase (LPLAT)-like uncharacterized protein